MKRAIGFLSILEGAIFLVTMLVTCRTAIGQQEAPAVSRPSTSSVQVTPRSTDSRYGSSAGTQTGMKVAAGGTAAAEAMDISDFGHG